MDSGSDSQLFAGIAWLLFAFSAMQLYRAARLYLRTRRITAQLLDIFIFGIAFGCIGGTHFRDSIPPGMLKTLALIGGVSGVLGAVVFVVYEKPWASKPPA
jgi:hypothetical protein